MNDESAKELARLRYAQTRIQDKAVLYLSLDPNRSEPTSLVDLFLRLAPSLPELEARQAFADGLEEVAEAILANFPENIFWDLDYLAKALAGAGSPRAIRLMTAMIVDLQNGFGCHSVIAFRYVHDFTFGFDWCRWVKKDLALRQDVGPFDWVFLLYLQKRRRELLDLIAKDDDKYGQLAPGQGRNPFVFSREPADERLLHETLAKAGDIPVPAWTSDGLCQFEKNFGEIRVQTANELSQSA